MKTAKTLRSKLIYTTAGIILFFGLLVLSLVYFQARNNLSSQLENNIYILTQSQKKSLQTVFTEGHKLSRQMSDETAVVDYLVRDANDLNDESDYEEMLERLNDWNVTGNYSVLFLMNADGTTISSSDETFVNNNYGFRNYFQKAMNGEPALEMAIGVTSRLPGYYFSYPIFHEYEIIGVAVAKMDPEWVHNSMVYEHPFNGTEVFLVDRNGVVIFASDEKFIYRSLWPLDDNETRQLDISRSFEGVEIFSIFERGALRDFFREFLGSQDSFVTYSDREAFYLLTGIENTPFLLMVSQSFESLDELSTRTVYLPFLLFVVVIFATVLSTYILMRRSFQSLDQLKTRVRSYEAGARLKPMKIEGSEEIVSIAKFFNRLIKQVNKSEKALKKEQDKLAKKVDELEALNKTMMGRELRIVELRKEA